MKMESNIPKLIGYNKNSSKRVHKSMPMFLKTLKNVIKNVLSRKMHTKTNSKLAEVIKCRVETNEIENFKSTKKSLKQRTHPLKR